MPQYRVYGTAHGSRFDESGFPTSEDARNYASLIIDGDLDAEINITSDETDEMAARITPSVGRWVDVEVVRRFLDGSQWLAITGDKIAARAAAEMRGTITESDQTDDGRWSFAIMPHTMRHDGIHPACNGRDDDGCPDYITPEGEGTYTPSRKVEYGGYMVPSHLVKGESADSLRVGLWLSLDLTRHAARMVREGKVADATFILDALQDTITDALDDASGKGTL